jgi:hypothetical protein
MANYICSFLVEAIDCIAPWQHWNLEVPLQLLAMRCRDLGISWLWKKAWSIAGAQVHNLRRYIGE